MSDSLDQKSGKIGSAKDRALDLHRRANNLANSASSKLANLLDMEKEYEENQRQLDSLSSQLTQLNCKMQIHLMVKSYYHKERNYYFLIAFGSDNNISFMVKQFNTSPRNSFSWEY